MDHSGAGHRVLGVSSRFVSLKAKYMRVMFILLDLVVVKVDGYKGHGQRQEQEVAGSKQEYNGWTALGRHERKDTWANEEDDTHWAEQYCSYSGTKIKRD